jgi:DNA-binding transcriptional regulator YhcF (GntR family)
MRVVRGLHLGHLHTGDRLPSIREVERELGINGRIVARAYRALEVEGLVEVRGRSGVYVAQQDQLTAKILPETARWLTEVLVEAWKRMIPFPALPEFIRNSSASVRLHCACVESSEDLMTVLSVELSNSFGLDVRPVYVDAIPVHEPGDAVDVDRLPAELRYADLVVTTPFHVGAVRAAAGALGKPIVVATMNPEIGLEVERHLRKRGLNVVVADPRSGEQLRATYAATHPDRLRIVLAEDAEAVARLKPSEPVLLTEAARRRLRDIGPWPLVPHSPWISVESARDLAALLIRLNLERKTP